MVSFRVIFRGNVDRGSGRRTTRFVFFVVNSSLIPARVILIQSGPPQKQIDVRNGSRAM